MAPIIYTSRSPLHKCLTQEAHAIAESAERIESEQAEKALFLLDQCYKSQSKLVTTGVGKSGIVARKISATFSSIGLTSIYLNPVDALHGDLGVVHPSDIAILLSNSGETDELIALLPHLERRGVSRIALVGRSNSTIACQCQVVLDASVDREVCPLNLAPTASTAVAMAIGDALAAVWMERAGISTQDFAINHPAGSLGRQLTLSVSEVMIPIDEIEPISAKAPLSDVISHLTQGSSQRGSLGSAWICDERGEMIGLITDGDLRRALQTQPLSDWQSITALSLATIRPITITPDKLAVEALKLMEKNPRKPISVLPVVSRSAPRNLKGFLRLHDLVQAGLRAAAFS